MIGLATSHVMLHMFSILMSGIPSSAGPAPGSIENLHLALLSLSQYYVTHTYLLIVCFDTGELLLRHKMQHLLILEIEF